jgi:hypothetical protein
MPYADITFLYNNLQVYIKATNLYDLFEILAKIGIITGEILGAGIGDE